MVADVSNLVSMLATQPVAQMQSIGQKVEAAHEYKVKQEQQTIENYRKSVKDNLEMQVNLGKLNKDQLEGIQSQMKITAGVAGSILSIKDPIAREHVFDQSTDLLRSAGHTEDRIEAARTKINDDNVLKGWIAQGAGIDEVYKTLRKQDYRRCPHRLH